MVVLTIAISMSYPICPMFYTYQLYCLLSFSLSILRPIYYCCIKQRMNSIYKNNIYKIYKKKKAFGTAIVPLEALEHLLDTYHIVYLVLSSTEYAFSIYVFTIVLVFLLDSHKKSIEPCVPLVVLSKTAFSKVQEKYELGTPINKINDLHKSSIID